MNNKETGKYIVSIDSMVDINAASEDEAMVLAKKKFIEMLQRDEAEFMVTIGIWSDLQKRS